MKKCTRCGEEKDLPLFGKDKTTRTGYKSSCLLCLAKARRLTYNIESERQYQKTDAYKRYQKRYKKSTRYIAQQKEYKRTSEHHKDWRKRYYHTPERVAWRKEYLKRPNVIVRESLRNRLRSALHGNYKKGMGVDGLGCSIPFFRAYLESLFTNGMSWQNYGEWHIDHIKPLSKFNLMDEEQVMVACNYKNMQPLWKHDNLSKSNKYEIKN